MCVSDPQDHAENFDDEAIGSTERLLSDEAEVEYPPERPHGFPFADSDVTDESFAEREEQQEPEISEPSDNDVEGSTEDSPEPDERA
jgi:hypothetical protein